MPEDSVPAIELTTSFVEPRELGCKMGVDSETIVREVEETVRGVMVGTEEERESVEVIGSSRGVS